MRTRFATGIIVGGLIGASTAMFMDMDKKSVKKLKKRMDTMQSKLKM